MMRLKATSVEDFVKKAGVVRHSGAKHKVPALRIASRAASRRAKKIESEISFLRFPVMETLEATDTTQDNSNESS